MNNHLKLRAILSWTLCLLWLPLTATPQFISFSPVEHALPVILEGQPLCIAVDKTDDEGIHIAVTSLQHDFQRVCGKIATAQCGPSKNNIIIGSIEKSTLIQQLIKSKKIDADALIGKREKYIIQTVDSQLVIAGSDMRGTIYGIYELSRQMGVSPWYWWADVPVPHHDNVYALPGTYTDGEPAVKYRGIFINDEAPCFTSWVKKTYGTDYGDHRMYANMFELILRLRGNFLWPAMWSWAFYADDPENSKTAQQMGIIMGTSHHEPMARNHQEWALNRRKYGAWDYQNNKTVLDKFFREGIERAKGTEDLITIGMRGDGDAPMSADANTKLLENIIANQRRIISDVTGKPAKETPQVWALYKEVMEYYDKGMKVPDDVIMLLCDDNWGNVNRLPNEKEKQRKGGFGMYYHVDYVGAPRNSKWLDCTPIQNLWEQMQLTYDYGVDKLWVLNVGDLKPMEYPITLFLDMAWNPHEYEVNNLLEHTRKFCAEQFGKEQAAEAARIMNLYMKYNGRCTPELLDADTYNLQTGEWQQVTQEYAQLETDALKQYALLPAEYHDSYQQLVLFPIQAMSNLYDLYFAVAQNKALYQAGSMEANIWANRAERDFARDKQLCNNYNTVMSHGKWDGMMTQKHIGYRSWNDNFREDRLPQLYRISSLHPADKIASVITQTTTRNNDITIAEMTIPSTEDTTESKGGYLFTGANGQVVIEAEHYFSKLDVPHAQWTVLPYMGRTLSGIAVRPYTVSPAGASLSYKMQIPTDIKEVTVHIITKSTLAFSRPKGHRYTITMDGTPATTVNMNGDMKDDKLHQYTTYYPVVARRVIEKQLTLPLSTESDGCHTLIFSPLDSGIVLEKLVIDYGGYQQSYLFGSESKYSRKE